MKASEQTTAIKVAAIQLDTVIGDTEKNLSACERLVRDAVVAGAAIVALPEFFNTGVSWKPALINVIENENGTSAMFLQRISEQHNIILGGSFMCRLGDGSVRNRYLCFDHGKLIGKHDKDLPTMWENAFYEGGAADDNGVLGTVRGTRFGTAVCWEFLRTATSRRLRGKVDVIIGGSHWWSMPMNWPAWLIGKAEAYNNANLLRTVQRTAALVGAPVIHASHCNYFDCDIPGLSFMKYRGQLEGHTCVIDGSGNVLSSRSKEEGEGIVVADIVPGSVAPDQPVPDRFWLRRRSWLPAFSWHFHGIVGRHWYRKNVIKAENN